MKLVVQNPHFLSETGGTKIHDYVLEMLAQFRPTIRIWPMSNLPRWYRFLWKKKLPLTGWNYVFSEKGLRAYDAWMNFNGKAIAGTERDPMPWSFSGLKVVHLMDYSFQPREDEERCRKLGVDFAFGYARHDLHCSFFQKAHPYLQGKVVPVPFGYLPRFSETIPFAEKENRASIMGAVVAMRSPADAEPALRDYFEHFAGKPCAHEMRWRIRNEGDSVRPWIASFLPKPTENVTWSYDSALELNRHRFFINDDSIMHYPPARTYEGLACGSVMLAARGSVWSDFGFEDGINCLLFEPGNLEDMMRVLKAGINDPERVRGLHDATLALAPRFSHPNVGVSLYRQIELLWAGRAEEAQSYYMTQAGTISPGVAVKAAPRS
jgi:hypothetical protein